MQIFEKKQVDLQSLSLCEKGIFIHVLRGNRWHSQVRLIEEGLMEGFLQRYGPGKYPGSRPAGLLAVC